MDLTVEFGHMASALFVAYKALLFGETPVACVVVDDRTNTLVSIGYNYTNVSLNGTRHAEYLALERLDGIDLSHYTLYVTVEPCIMCASYLRQKGIHRVVYGAGNDRFGGNGTVISVNLNDKLPNNNYSSYGGICRTEGIQLLRNFYIQENDSAPTPQTKRNKEIDSKEFPENNVTYDEATFDSFFGKERRDLLEDRTREFTPVVGKGYSIMDLFTESTAKSLPYISQELGGVTTEEVADFYKYFWEIDNDGKVKHEEAVNVYNLKKRPLEE